MKVLHVITTINRGGAENHLLDLVAQQAASGILPEVAWLKNEPRDMGVPIHDLSLRFYGDPKPVQKLRRILDSGSFDLVHAHLPPAELYARLALVGRTQPLVISKHNDERFCDMPGERLLGRWVACRASKVIAISEAVEHFMTGPGLGLPQGKVETIHYGIDSRPFEETPDDAGKALRRSWGVPEDAMLIGFAGRFVPQKSLETLLEGFARLPGNSWLALVGRGPLEARLRMLAGKIGVADRVVWPGFQEDMRAVMKAFDVFAITSVHEGFGLVLAEAMASSRPVVATRAGAMPEVVADGETGLLVPPGDPDRLAEAFQKMTNADVRRRLGEAGLRRVRQHFTLERMRKRTESIYRNVAGAEHAQFVPAGVTSA